MLAIGTSGKGLGPTNVEYVLRDVIVQRVDDGALAARVRTFARSHELLQRFLHGGESPNTGGDVSDLSYCHRARGAAIRGGIPA
jgi:adenylosuccinate synthase